MIGTARGSRHLYVCHAVKLTLEPIEVPFDCISANVEVRGDDVRMESHKFDGHTQTKRRLGALLRVSCSGRRVGCDRVTRHLSLVTTFRTFASLDEIDSGRARRRLLASPILEKLQINHFVGSHCHGFTPLR